MSLVTEAINVPKVELTDEEIFAAHVGGKLSVETTAPLDTQRALSIAYTPGVAQVSRAIAADETLADRYTWTNRLVVVGQRRQPRFSDSATSALARRCPSWRASRRCSRTSPD